MPFRPFSRDIVYAMPPALDDWVAEDHAVRSWPRSSRRSPTPTGPRWGSAAPRHAWARLGTPADDPLPLRSAWLGGFLPGTRSSRKLAAACHDLAPMRWWEPAGHRQPATRPYHALALLCRPP